MLPSSWPPAATLNLASSGVRAYVNSALTRPLGVLKHARGASQRKVTVGKALLRDLRADWTRPAKEEDKLEEVKKEQNRPADVKQGDEAAWQKHAEGSDFVFPAACPVSVPQRKKPHVTFLLLEITTTTATFGHACSSSPLSPPLYSWLTLYCHGNSVTVSHLHISLLLNLAEKERGTEREM